MDAVPKNTIISRIFAKWFTERPTDRNNDRYLTTISRTFCPKKSVAGKQEHRKLHGFNVGTPCYTFYCGPWRDSQPKWIKAVVTKVLASLSVNIQVMPGEPVWKWHIHQFYLQHINVGDAEPSEEITVTDASTTTTPTKDNSQPSLLPVVAAPTYYRRRNPRLLDGDEHSRDNPQQSTRSR